MELNTNVWGTGVNAGDNNGGNTGVTINNLYYAGSGNYAQSFIDLVRSNKLQLNTPYDKSLSWGIKFNSLLSDNLAVQYISRTNEWRISQGHGNLLPFLYVDNTVGASGTAVNVYDKRFAYGQSDIYQINNGWAVVKAPLNCICLLLKVMYYNPNTTAPVNFSLMDYDEFEKLPNETKDLYVILGLDIQVYYGTKKSRNRNGYNNRIRVAWRIENPMKAFTNSDNVETFLSMFFTTGDFVIGGVGWNIDNTNIVRPSIYVGVNLNLFNYGLSDDYNFVYLKNGWHDLYKLRNSIADLGLYYTGTTLSATDSELGEHCTDSKIFCGGIDDEGKMTGIPYTGENIKDNNNFTPYVNTPNDYYNNNFNGEDKTDPNNYTDKIDLNKPTLTPVDVFNRSYAINATTVRNFADFLWNADETKFNEIIKGLGLMGENPINGVIDLRLYPFNVATKNGATTAEEIAIGRIATGITGIKLTNNVNSIINLGECSFFTKFKNFLDYEPFTTAQLYIPYIGVVPVSTAEFMGHNISVKMIVDYITGACCAIVFKDDIPFIYRNGVVGISIPITGTDSASYANTVIGNVVSGAVGGITSIASGNIGGVVSSAEKLYSGFATGTNYQEASASSPSVATWQPQKCYFIIDRPILNVPDNYGRTVGYACEQTGKLSDFKGFTVVSNPEITFKCTETEKTMLSQLLTTGVFI